MRLLLRNQIIIACLLASITNHVVEAVPTPMPTTTTNTTSAPTVGFGWGSPEPTLIATLPNFPPVSCESIVYYPKLIVVNDVCSHLVLKIIFG